MPNDGEERGDIFCVRSARARINGEEGRGRMNISPGADARVRNDDSGRRVVRVRAHLTAAGEETDIQRAGADACRPATAGRELGLTTASNSPVWVKIETV